MYTTGITGHLVITSNDSKCTMPKFINNFPWILKSLSDKQETLKSKNHKTSERKTCEVQALKMYFMISQLFN